MTRINVVPVQELCDEHLRAEFREITRIPSHIIKCDYLPNLEDQPADYVLGSGHVKFFYDKIYFIKMRFYDLQDEMTKRGFKADKGLMSFFHRCPARLYKDYTPTAQALTLNRKRIQKRWPKNAHYHGIRWNDLEV